MKFTGTIASVNPKGDDTSIVTNLLPKADMTSSITNLLPKPDNSSIIAPVSPIGDDTSIISSFGQSDTKIQQTRVDVEGDNIGTDTTAKQEIETLDFSSSGNSGVIVNTPASNQAYSYGYTGTGGTNVGSVVADGEELDVTFTQFEADGTTPRVSGVFTEAGDGKYALSIGDTAFDSGATHSAIQLDLNGTSDSVTHGASDIYSWPTGDISTGLDSGWTYTAGGGSGGASVQGELTNNTGSLISLHRIEMSITINFSSLPTDGDTAPALFVRNPSTGSIILLISPGTISATGSQTFTKTSLLNEALEDGEYLSFYWFESTAADRPFTYTVTDIQIDIPASASVSFSLDLDTADTVLTGTATGSASDGASLTTFLGEVSSVVTTQYSSVTAGSVVSSNIELTASGTGEDNRDTASFIESRDWDVRESTAFNSATVSYSSWGDWASNSLHIGGFVSPGWLSTSFGDLWSYSIGQAGSTLVVTDSEDSGNTATFSVTPGYVSNLTLRMQFSLDSLVSSSGTPPTSFGGTDGWIYTLTAESSHKSVLFDTHQTTELTPSFSVTDNSGNVGTNQISNVFGKADQLSLTLAPEHASTPILTTLSSQGGYVQNAGELAESIIARQSSTNKAKGTFSFAANSSNTAIAGTPSSFTVTLSGFTFPIGSSPKISKITGREMFLDLTTLSSSIDTLQIYADSDTPAIDGQITSFGSQENIVIIKSATSHTDLASQVVTLFNNVPTTSSGDLTEIPYFLGGSTASKYRARQMVASSSGADITFTYLQDGDVIDATIGNEGTGTTSTIVNTDGTGSPATRFYMSGDPRLFSTGNVTELYTDNSDRASQLTQVKTAFDAKTTSDVTGVISGNDLVLEADNARAYDEFSVTLSNIADPTAVNVRSDHVSDILVSGNNTKEVFDITFNDINLTAAEFDNLDQVSINNVFDPAVHPLGTNRFTIRPGGSNSSGNGNANNANYSVQTPASLYDNTQEMVDHYNAIVGRLYTMSKVSDGHVKLTAINYGVLADVTVERNGGANDVAFGASGSVTTSGAGDGIVSIDSTVTGDIVDSVYSTVGGTSSTSLSTLTHEVRGVDGSIRESSVLNITNASTSHGHTNAAYSATLANVIAGVNIGNAIVTGFGVIGGFTMGTPTSTAVTAEDDASGVANTVNVAVVQGTNEDGTTANIAVTNTTTTTGANTFNTGTHTALNINFNGESFPITYANDRTPAQQASDTVAEVNSNSTKSSASLSGNVATLTTNSAGVVADGSVLVSAVGTPTSGTYTAPVQTITQQGTGGVLSFTSTIEGGGLTGNATYSAFSATKAQWITGMSTAVNSNTDARVYKTDTDGFAFASEAQDTYPNGTYTVSDETGNLTITMTTLYKGHN